MALHAKNLSFLFLLVLSTSLQIEARQSKFLTEAIHYHINKTSKTTQEIESPSPSPAPSPLLAPTPELAPASTAEVEAPISPLLAPTPPQLAPATADQVEYGYGLYGYNSNSDTSTSTNANKGYSDIYDDRLYAAGSDNAINSNGDSYGYNVNKNEYVNEGQQGLGDNGENDNYFQNGYQQMRGGEGYYGNNQQMRGGEGYYGNNVESKYEFNTMEEYERQEEYGNSHEDEYIP